MPFGVKIGFDLNTVKSQFFDRQAVLSAVDKATRKVLSRFGAFVRTRAKSSIRKAKGPSAPGSPPHSHVGLLRQFIFFMFNPSDQSVVIGPTLIRQRSAYGPTTVPEVEEYGGTVARTIRFKRWQKVETARYPARPFMGPAFEYEKVHSLPKMWADSVK